MIKYLWYRYFILLCFISSHFKKDTTLILIYATKCVSSLNNNHNLLHVVKSASDEISEPDDLVSLELVAQNSCC
jgi:hypothetical protein